MRLEDFYNEFTEGSFNIYTNEEHTGPYMLSKDDVGLYAACGLKSCDGWIADLNHKDSLEHEDLESLMKDFRLTASVLAHAVRLLGVEEKFNETCDTIDGM